MSQQGQEVKNEMHLEMMGIQGLNAFSRHNSASRSYMFGSHISQRLVISGAEEKRVQTGLEREFSRYTFSVKMPTNAQIIKVIQRYPQGADKGSLDFNPETFVIFENDETKEIDYISIPHYASYHQFFGFKYDLKFDQISKLRPGAFIPKDTIFADSPGVTENGGYMYGTNLNAVFMSIPSVSEDGVMISKSALEKLKFRVYETRVVEFGAGQFPLNLYGTKDLYKPFPEINTPIREDGLLMMLRTYDNDLMPVELSVYDTMEPDFTFDKGVYARGGEGRVIDIKVISNNNPVKQLPDAMCEQVDKYSKALFKFHKEIVDTEANLRYERKRKFGEAKLKISPKLQRLVVESLAVTNHNVGKFKQSLNLLYRKAPIDEYRIEFVIEYVMTPTIGFKLTDVHGGKGVIVKIEEDCNMPVDADGNVAEIVMDPASVGSRMNLGRLYEHYVNSAGRDVCKAVCGILGVQPKITMNRLMQISPDVIQHAYMHLLRMYQIVCEKQYKFFAHDITDDEKLEHLLSVVNDGIYLYYPIDTDKNTVDVIKNLEKAFKPTYGPVTYVGNSGEKITTKVSSRIGPLYMMLLDKIADDWSSVSSGKLQHFGVLSPTTKSEKFSNPYRNSPVRTIGETEGRIFAGYCGREAIAEMMDRSNNPATQRNVAWSILNADKPTNIKHVVDRDYIRLGGARPLQLVRHIIGTAGYNIVYEPETPYGGEDVIDFRNVGKTPQAPVPEPTPVAERSVPTVAGPRTHGGGSGFKTELESKATLSSDGDLE